MKRLFILFFFFTSTHIFAQTLEDVPVDGYFSNSIMEGRKVIPYSDVNSGNVFFAKRIWREIDLTDTANYVFASPQIKLIDVLVDAINAGELTAYDPTPTKKDPFGDSFLKRYSSQDAMNRLVDSVLVPEFDDEGYEIGSTLMNGEFNSNSVTKFRIKEDWFYDKQRSVFETRIIGIAPLIAISMADVQLNEQPAFWIYFPEARHILVNRDVIDPTGRRVSFDDLFTRRLFSSTIVKESNSMNVESNGYLQGEERIKETERINNQIEGFEKSIWIELPKESQKPKRGLFKRKDRE